MASGEVLVFKLLLLIDAVSSSAISFCNVSTLDHEAIHYSMDLAAQIVKLTSLLCLTSAAFVLGVTITVLSGAQAPEVFGRDRCDIVVELEDHTTCGLGSNCELHKDSRMLRHSFERV